MSRFRKAFFNNINKSVYLKNIHSLKLKNDSSNTETKDMIDKSGKYSLDEIIRLETDVRMRNLNVFLETFVKLRAKRFCVITLPALLTAATIGVHTLPTRHDELTTVTTLEGKHKVYNSDLGEVEFTKKYFKGTEGDAFCLRHVSENNEQEIGELSYLDTDTLSFRIYDDEMSFLAEFMIDEDGELTVNKDIKVGDIIDFNDYKDYDFSNLDQDYYDLINRIIIALNSSDMVSDEQRQILANLNESDKKVIVAEIIQYTEGIKEDILISKTRMPLKIILSILLGLYLFVEILEFSLYDKKSEFFTLSARKIENCHGELKKGYGEEIGIFFGPLMLKEEFIAAEKERIKNIRDEIEKNTTEFASSAPVLTKYERKLFKY